MTRMELAREIARLESIPAERRANYKHVYEARINSLKYQLHHSWRWKAKLYIEEFIQRTSLQLIEWLWRLP